MIVLAKHSPSKWTSHCLLYAFYDCSISSVGNVAFPKRLASTTAPNYKSRDAYVGCGASSQSALFDRGKPTQSAQVESFNGRVRDELLNLNCFPDVFAARAAAEAWLIDYNELRPHSSLGYMTPIEFINSQKRTQLNNYPRRESAVSGHTGYVRRVYL
jgi:hypothetical protein